jgi:hypothetical protein
MKKDKGFVGICPKHKQDSRKCPDCILEKVNNLIVDEILICHHENTPTSRLTSLVMKLTKL